MDKLKIFAPIAIYGVIVGLLYSFSFWDRFSINPLQFASPMDLAKVAAWPLAATALIAVFNTVISGAANEDWSKFTHGDVEFSSIPKWMKISIKIIWDASIIVTIIWLFIKVTTPVRWYGIGLCIVILTGGAIERQPLIRTLIPNVRLRVVAIWLALIAPFLAIGAGAIAAEEIKAGQGSFLLDMDHSTIPAVMDRTVTQQFVGTLGNFYVFYAKNSSISMLKIGDGQTISFKHNLQEKSHNYQF